MQALIVTVRRHDEINNFASLKMGPVLTSLSKLHQNHCQWCVEGNGAGAGE
jgi:hypothetical protein